MQLKGITSSPLFDLLRRPWRRQKQVAPNQETQPDKPILDHALQRLRNHGIPINSLIDVGASNGIWSNSFAQHFPGRHHLLLEANQVYAEALARISGQQMAYEYVDKNRIGDHICYISDLSKMRSHYPSCDITKGVTGRH